MPKWTVEQQAAIDARNCNLLVAAAAGSGKTAVLVERILQLIIKDRVDLDRLLVVTFTNAAAGEMRERIGSALMKAIDDTVDGNGQASEKDSDHLRRQLNLLTKASISTLHSFCIRIIRKYFHIIDLDPGFRIGDETECSLLKIEVIEELFEAQYEKASEDFLGLVERYSDNRQDAALQELVLRLHSFIQSKPFPQEWLEERVQDFAKDINQLENSPWAQALLSTIKMETQGVIDMLQEALSLCQRPYGPLPYQENIMDDLQQMNDILMSAAKKNLQACSKYYEQTKFSKLKSCRKGEADETLKERVKDLRDKAKEAWKGLGGGILTKGLEQSVSQLNELYPYMQCLCDLVLEFHRQFAAKKQEKGIIDFNDLEHYALDILKNEQVAEELQDSYDYIFIDEYQDSNLVQDTILGYIRKNDNMFMVGDVKQSIYRFRLADPTIFLDKYDTYKAGEGQVDRRIDLNRNFRSRPYILDGVNYLFEHLMSAQFGELEYDDTAALYPGLTDEHPNENQKIELHLIEKALDDDEELDPEIEDLSDVEVEAAIAADRIQKLIGTELYDAKKEEYRKVDYSDIVLLLRSTKMQAPVYQEVFTARGIPVYADSNTGYFEAQEVKTIVALLKVIDNKLQDIPLLTVMRSPIGGFNADDMIIIRTKGKGKTFYQAVFEYMNNQEDELAHRLNSFFNKIEGWQKASRYLPMEDFIWKLYRESGYFAYVSVMPGGTQRQANLRLLLERARQFQQTSIRGLFQFTRFIDSLQNSSGDMGVAKTLGENENVLRIMSIHKSKGLEFPVVVLSGLGKLFNLSDTNASILFHKDLGLGPKYVNPDTRQTCDTIAKSSMKQVIRLESLSEEMRVLYVALTRAKDRLILIGSCSDLQKTAGRWAKPVSAYSLSKGRSYLDWIGPILMRHPAGNSLRNLLDEDFDQALWNHNSRWQIEFHGRGEVTAYHREEAKSRSEFMLRLQNPEKTITELIQKQKANKTQEYREVRECMVGDILKVEDETRLDYTASSGVGNRWEDEVKRLRGIIDERFSWEYPYRYAVNIPSKMSVTEIRKLQSLRGTQLLEDTEEFISSFIDQSPGLRTRPAFLEGSKRFTAAERGTIVHFILQHLDLDKAMTEEGILKQIEDMVARELLTEEEAQAANMKQINGFLNSEIGQRIRNAAQVFREHPFNLRKKSHELMETLQANEDTLLIQGVIDCFFEEEGQWVLVDYKTDYVGSGEMLLQLKERYRIQMDLYTEALEQITGKQVKERVLYLLSINQAVRM